MVDCFLLDKQSKSKAQFMSLRAFIKSFVQKIQKQSVQQTMVEIGWFQVESVLLGTLNVAIQQLLCQVYFCQTLSVLHTSHWGTWRGRRWCMGCRRNLLRIFSALFRMLCPLHAHYSILNHNAFKSILQYFIKFLFDFI